MRDYGKLFCAFWTSDTIQKLSDDAKLLAAYLLTNEHCTLIGCYRLSNGYVSDDLAWEESRVTKGFAELFNKGFATRCEASKWVLIHKYLEWNPLENPNQHTAAKRMFEKMPDSVSVKGDLARLLNIIKAEPLSNPSGTLSKPVAVAVEVEVDKPVFAKATSNHFQEFWELMPATSRRVAKSDCEKKWRKKNLDAVAEQILAHVAKLKETKSWQEGFEPAPMTYLNQSRWLDGESQAAAPAWAGAK